MANDEQTVSPPEGGQEDTALETQGAAEPSGGALMGVVRWPAEVTAGTFGVIQSAIDKGVGTVRWPAEVAVGTFIAIQGAFDRGLATAFPECSVPAYMLPTGPDPDDYVLVFDLEEFLSNLRSGVFVRPAIHLWAASADNHDTRQLAEMLSARFAEDFNLALAQTIESGESAVAEAKETEDSSLQEVGSELSGESLRSWSWLTAGAVLGAGGIAFAPVGVFGAIAVPAIMMGLGFKPRTAIFGVVGNYLSARSDRATAEKDLEREQKKLEREFRRKRKALQRAVERLEIREHPALQRAAAALPPPPPRTVRHEPPEKEATARDSREFPDVGKFLQHPAYLEALVPSQPSAAPTAASTELGSPAQPQPESAIGFFRRLFR